MGVGWTAIHSADHGAWCVFTNQERFRNSKSDFYIMYTVTNLEEQHIPLSVILTGISFAIYITAVAFLIGKAIFDLHAICV